MASSPRTVFNVDGNTALPSGTLTLGTETLDETLINLGGILALNGDATLDASSVLNVAFGGGDIIQRSGAGSLTLEGVSYASSLGGIFSIKAPLHNYGTLVIANGATVDLTTTIDGTGTIALGPGVLVPGFLGSGTIAASQTINFVGGGGTIELNLPTYLTLSTSEVDATIRNFGSGDAIDLNATADHIVYTAGTLTATNDGTVVISLALVGNYVSSDFQLVPAPSFGDRITTTVAPAPVTNAPTITAPGTTVIAAVSATPFSGLTVSDPDATSVDSLSVTSSAGVGVLTNPGGSGMIGETSSSYGSGGSAATLTQSLQGLVLTVAPTAPAIATTTLTAAVTNPNGAATTRQTVILLNQYGDLAGRPGSAFAVSAPADGTSFASPAAGLVNEALATTTAAGRAVFLPAGYRAAYVASVAGVTLVDPGIGHAVLADSAGNDLIYANGDGDVVIGGTGSDTIVATRGAYLQSTAIAGNTLIFGGAGATSIFGPGVAATSTIVAGAGDTTVSSQGFADLIGLGAGNDLAYLSHTDTVFAGAGAATILAGQGDFIVLGANTAVVGGRGDSTTILGGSGATTASLSFRDVMFGGSGNMLVSSVLPSVFIGGAGSATVFGSGTIKGGSNGHNIINLDAEYSNNQNTAYGAGDGDVLISSAAGVGVPVLTTNLVAGAGNETLTATAGSTATALFAGSGNAAIFALGAQDTIFGGAGAASVSTGTGTYDFVFSATGGGGATSISGFDPARFSIQLTGFAPGTGAIALAGASIVDGSESLTLVDGTRITLVGFTGLTAANFAG